MHAGSAVVAIDRCSAAAAAALVGWACSVGCAFRRRSAGPGAGPSPMPSPDSALASRVRPRPRGSTQRPPVAQGGDNSAGLSVDSSARAVAEGRSLALQRWPWPALSQPLPLPQRVPFPDAARDRPPLCAAALHAPLHYYPLSPLQPTTPSTSPIAFNRSSADSTRGTYPVRFAVKVGLVHTSP